MPFHPADNIFYAKIAPMKLWIKDTSTPTHHIIYYTTEPSENVRFFKELDDEGFKAYLRSLSSKIDVEKHLKLISYFGYLHIFAKKES